MGLIFIHLPKAQVWFLQRNFSFVTSFVFFAWLNLCRNLYLYSVNVWWTGQNILESNKGAISVSVLWYFFAFNANFQIVNCQLWFFMIYLIFVIINWKWNTQTFRKNAIYHYLGDGLDFFLYCFYCLHKS